MDKEGFFERPRLDFLKGSFEIVLCGIVRAYSKGLLKVF